MKALEVPEAWLESLRDTAFGGLMRQWLVQVFTWIDAPILAYFLIINTSYLVLIVLAILEFSEHLRRMPFSGLDADAASPLTQPVSLIVPAYHEEVVIVSAVRSLLALRYPVFEIVIVVDGDPDPTLDVLRDSFDLVQVPMVYSASIATKAQPTALYLPRDGRMPLQVVVKPNSGRADSGNVGVNVAQYPLVCMIDADSILDPDALLVVAKPFADDPVRVVATGGVIRALNGCDVYGGRVTRTRMPKDWLARIQVVEYLRAFMLGRTGFSRMHSLVLISGAFGLFRKDVFTAVGGMNADSIGEDFDLVMRIHRHMRDTRRDYRLVFVAEPVLWTEVPSTFAVLGRQRRRWHRGLWEVLWSTRDMMLRPRYGRIGAMALPYYWAFELVAPLLELGGLVLVVLGLIFDAVNPLYGVTFALVAYVYGMLVSVAAVCAEEFSFHRYSSWRDLGVVLAATVVENLGYRQLTAWWRLHGWWQALTGRKQEWGTMTRTGVVDSLALEAKGPAS